MTTILVDAVRVERAGDKLTFIMSCRIEGGVVSPGNLMKLDYGEQVEMTIPVDEIVIDGVGSATISVACDDLEEVDFLNGLDLVGEQLTT